MVKTGRQTLENKTEVSAWLADKAFKQTFCGALESFLPTKRWYSAKDDTIKAVDVEAVAPLSAKTTFAVVRVELNGGDAPMFIIPLRAAFGEQAKAVNPDAVICSVEDGVIFDAAGESDFSAGVLDLMAKDAMLAVGNGLTFKASATAKGKALIEAVAGLPQKMMGVEQSNTSLIVGKKIMLKVYRRVAYGENPEIVTSAFLTETAKFENTPAYLGKAELVSADGKILGVGILQAFVANDGDGWGFTMNYLQSVFAKVKNGEAIDHADYLKTAALLGKRTAEMHKAFAKGTDKVFAPAPVANADLTDWTAQVVAQADRTIAVAKANVASLTGEMRRKVENLIARRDAIVERIEALVPSDVKCMKTRFHGDYHLGQVVVANGDFFLLDFEGEPLRPIAERQIKHCVLKDVAGMVRSFDYAAFGSVLMFVAEADRPQMLPVAAEWQKQATEAFLNGYFQNMAGCASLPDKAADTQKLLDLFILEKALYEVIYEVANRPDWLAIPMNGLSRLIDLDGE